MSLKPFIAGFLSLGVVAVLMSGCGPKVTRVGLEEQIDLSGNWNDTDSRLVSQEMIGDMLKQRWLSVHTSRTGKEPVVTVGTLRNLSHEHINMNTFIADIQRAMINSGEIEFVASQDDRGEIREERRQQDVHAREDTRKAMGQEIGADFVLTGTISTIIDTEGKTAVKYYQVDLTLTSVADNRMVWIGQKKIRKLVERAKVRP
ncbi:MAG: penicillin-binding protein activator LpoB [Campylobacterales bacterium]